MSQGSVQPPSGIITFLFTDIEGSTRLLGALGERYEQLLEQHNGLLREAWKEYGGYEIDAVGDSFLVAFEQADMAFRAAITAQQLIAEARWPGTSEIRVRMGLHSGYAKPRAGRYVALSLHQAARVVNAANGGQVFLTQTSRELLKAISDSELIPLGLFRVRDFDHSLPLFKAKPIGWRDPDVPPRLRPAESHNLVRPASDLLGREDDLMALRDALSANRVVTVLGLGGVGKTHLVTELGIRDSSTWADGAWFVSLAALTTENDIALALAEAVGVPLNAQEAPVRQVIDYLVERHMLLIFDNCEHLTRQTARLLTALQRDCPRIQFLNTSQVPLGLRNEKLFRLSELSTEGGADSAAIQLFMQRSGCESDELAVVGKLCEKLEGLPLALELAAARARSIPVATMLEQLSDGLEMLHSSDPQLSDRHQSISNAVQWSIGLLKAQERAVLESLSVLTGDFSLDCARTIASSDALSQSTIAVHVWALVERSLLVPEHTAGSTRFRMPGAIKATVWSMISAQKRQVLLSALTRYFCDCFPVMEFYKPSIHRAFGAELANVCGVLSQSCSEDPKESYLLASVVVSYFSRFSSKHIAIKKGLQFLGEFTAQVPERILLMGRTSLAMVESGRYEAAAELLNAAEELTQKLAPPAEDPTALASARALMSLHNGDPKAALALIGEHMEHAVDSVRKAWLQNTRGIILSMLGKDAEAHAAFENCVRLALDGDDVQTANLVIGNIAEQELKLGNLPKAARLQLEALEYGRSQDNVVPLATSLFVAARLLAERGEFADAAACKTAAAQLYDELGIQLFDFDQAIINELEARLKDQLSGLEYEAACSDGAKWSKTEAADHAEKALQLFIDNAVAE